MDFLGHDAREVDASPSCLQNHFFHALQIYSVALPLAGIFVCCSIAIGTVMVTIHSHEKGRGVGVYNALWDGTDG